MEEAGDQAVGAAEVVASQVDVVAEKKAAVEVLATIQNWAGDPLRGK